MQPGIWNEAQNFCLTKSDTTFFLPPIETKVILCHWHEGGLFLSYVSAGPGGIIVSICGCFDTKDNTKDNVDNNSPWEGLLCNPAQLCRERIDGAGIYMCSSYWSLYC